MNDKFLFNDRFDCNILIMKKIITNTLVTFLFLLQVSQVNAEVKKVIYDNNIYSISIPAGYCDISDTVTGNFLLDHMIEISNKNPILPKPKMVFTKCGKDLENEEIYPWGYVGFETVGPQLISQRQYNNFVENLMDSPGLLESHKQDMDRALENQYSKYELDADFNTVRSQKVVWSDANGITHSAINSGIIEGETFVEIVHGTSTLLDGAIVHIYLSDLARGDGSEKEIALSLISNSKNLRELN
jgi:hypothetical protein